MKERPARYGWSFDAFTALPLVSYLLIVFVLVAGVFSRITIPALWEAFSDPALGHAIILSLVTSGISTVLAVLVAVPGAYFMSRHRFPGYFLVDTLLDLPIVLPPLVMGLCVLIFFNTSVGRWIDRGIVKEGLFIYQPMGIVLVQFVVGCAFAVRAIKAGFDGIDRRLEEVSLTLGARRGQAFFKVVLPNIIPSLIAGLVISWARIFGLFGPVLLVAGTMRNRTEIMPTTIFLETSIGRLEVALVVGACMILISSLTLIAFKRLGGKGYLW
ncbi:MAG: ABC transporter permease [Candidatus Brocadiia bacterium]